MFVSITAQWSVLLNTFAWLSILKILPMHRILSGVIALRQWPMKSLDSRQWCDVIRHFLKVMTPDKIRRIGRIFDIAFPARFYFKAYSWIILAKSQKKCHVIQTTFWPWTGTNQPEWIMWLKVANLDIFQASLASSRNRLIFSVHVFFKVIQIFRLYLKFAFP